MVLFLAVFNTNRTTLSILESVSCARAPGNLATVIPHGLLAGAGNVSSGVAAGGCFLCAPKNLVYMHSTAGRNSFPLFCVVSEMALHFLEVTAASAARGVSPPDK